MSSFKVVAQRRLERPRAGVLSVVARLPGDARHLVWRAANGAPSEVIPLAAHGAGRTDAELLDLGAAQLLDLAAAD
jgi:hypothetical protein